MLPLNKENFLHQLPEFKIANCKFLLAVSGGVDSMVLLDLFMKSNLKFEVAHVNYRLRGDSSDKDQKLVELVCKKNGLTLHIHQVPDQEKPENSVQLWAREIRYRFFREIMAESQLDFLITAHHLNDQLETFLINLSRGTGIRGLTGIPQNDNRILRPLNSFTKKQITDYAEINNVAFREDESNEKTDYLRNRIRHRIVPELIDLNPDFLVNFSGTIDKLSQTADFLGKQSEEIYGDLAKEQNNAVILDKKKLKQQPDLIRFEILRKFGFESDTEIRKIFGAETGKTFQNSAYKLVADREQLVITKTDDAEHFTEQVLAETGTNEISLAGFSTFPEFGMRTKEWCFNKKALQFPLRIRLPKSGDRFFPVGFSGSKTVSKFLKDEKMPILARLEIRLLCDAEDRVLGVIPLRQDCRFSIERESEDSFKIKF